MTDTLPLYHPLFMSAVIADNLYCYQPRLNGTQTRYFGYLVWNHRLRLMFPTLLISLRPDTVHGLAVASYNESGLELLTVISNNRVDLLQATVQWDLDLRTQFVPEGWS
jgi:hypothetical protein